MKKLVLSNDVFSGASIEKARAIYSEFAQITVIPTKQYWTLLFTHCKYDEVQTIQEFENYLIGVENS